MDSADKRIQKCLNEINKLIVSNWKCKGFVSNEEDSIKKQVKDDWDRKERLFKLNNLLITIQDLIDNEDVSIDSLLFLLISIKKRIIIFINTLKSSEDLDLSSNKIQLSSLQLNQENFSLSSTWETVSYQIENVVVKNLIENNLNDLIKIETFYQQLSLLQELKSETSNNDNFLFFFNQIRSQRLEKHFANNDLDFEKLKKWIELDLNLINCYHLFERKVSYSQLITPYILLLKNKLSYKIDSNFNQDESFFELIKNIHLLMDFDQFVLDRDSSFPSDQWSLSQTLDEIWSWKKIIVKKGLDTFFLKHLNQQLIDLLKSSSFSEPLKSNNDTIISGFISLFNLLDCYYDIDLENFKNSFDVIVKVSVIELIVEHISKFYQDIDDFNHLYFIYNSLLYVQSKLKSYRLIDERINQMIEKLSNNIKSKHFTFLIGSTQCLEYILIYFKKLYFTLLQYLPNFESHRCNLFLDIFGSYLDHLVKASVSTQDLLTLCLNSLDLLLPYLETLDTLSSDRFQKVYSCIWILICKFTLKACPLSLFYSFFSNLSNESENNSNQIDNWLTLLDLNILPPGPYLSAYLCSLRSSPSSLMIIKPFLESKYCFSINILTSFKITLENKSNAVKLLTSILRLALLNESQPNSLVLILFPIIQRDNEWSFLDRSYLNHSFKPWWFQSLEQLMDPTVSHFMDSILPSFIYKASLFNPILKSIYSESGLLDQYHDFKSIIKECTLVIFKSIVNIIQIIAYPLITSLEKLTSTNINFLFDSFTVQLTISCILKHLNQDQNWRKFKKALIDDILNTLKIDLFVENFTKEISKVIETRLKQTKNFIVTSESNHINLIASLITSDPTYQSTLNFLFSFLKTNSNTFRACTIDSIPLTDIKLGFSSSTSDNLNKFDIIREFESIRHLDLTLFTTSKWLSLLNQVKLRLSPLPIRTILLTRKDFIESEEDYIKKVKNFYGIN